MSSMRSWHESLPNHGEQIRLAGNSGSMSCDISRDIEFGLEVRKIDFLRFYNPVCVSVVGQGY